jgi:hypothetical protein
MKSREREKSVNANREKFSIIVRVRPRLKEDVYSYKETDMDEIVEVT